jgi:ribonuclease P protein component
MVKKEVLRNKKDFSRIYGKGKSVGDHYVVLFFIKNGLGYNRRAFLASKKVGNSVQRNRARRLLRQSWISLEGKLPVGYDFIVIARNKINGAKCPQVEASLRRAVKHSGLRRV